MTQAILSPERTTVEIPTKEYIELLEFKLDSLNLAKKQDSSWNYGIEELEKEIKELKAIIS